MFHKPAYRFLPIAACVVVLTFGFISPSVSDPIGSVRLGGSNQARVFQMGMTGYTGVRDTSSSTDDWDDGNQVGSPVDGLVKHGTTGDKAFHFYRSEGLDVRWGERGMAAGSNIDSGPESYVAIGNEGWYTWDMTGLVRSWIRGEQANYGVALRDATSYEDDHMDERAFISSQALPHTERRPKLTEIYHPDVPSPHAGTDFEDLAWDGSAPTGSLHYEYIPTAFTLNVLFDLPSTSRYQIITSGNEGGERMTGRPDIKGAHRPSDQGVLSTILDGEGDVQIMLTPTSTVSPSALRYWLPLILRTRTQTPIATATPTILPIQTSAPPQVAGCDVFPTDNIWNTRVDDLPVDPNSDAYIASIGFGVSLHPDFGAGLWDGGPIGIPYVTVPSTQSRVSVDFTYDDESDPGPYPIPTEAAIEGGPDSEGDRHVLVVERKSCLLYELFYAWPQADGNWSADAGAIFDLNSHTLRPDGWTSADAAGLAILPGLVRYEEVADGRIAHALRFTAPQTRRSYLWPARHQASDLTGPQYPPMGQRFRLRRDFDISGFSPDVKVILQALKEYGMMLADNGSSWYISGVPDERWDNDVLRELRQVHGSDFEAVDVSALMVDPDSGQVRVRETPGVTPVATTTPTIHHAHTASPTATRPAIATSTQTPTPTSNPPISAALFVDDDNISGRENGTRQYPYNTMQEALNAAEDGEAIAVAAGTYAENVRVQGKAVHLYGGYTGGTAADYERGLGGDFNDRNSPPNRTHIQGDGTDSAVTLIDAGVTILDGFRITGGTRSVEGLPWYYTGGGIYVSGGAPVLAHNIIENNDTRTASPGDEETFGGGIYADHANLTIHDNLIRSNTSGRGAGIAIDGGRVVISDNRIIANIGTSDHGGGLYIAAPAVELVRNQITDNEIGLQLGYGWGGGVVIYGEESVATLSFNTITGNHAPTAGSGVFIDDGAEAILNHELIVSNHCTEMGGAGIYVDGAGEGEPGDVGSTAQIIHSTVADHECDSWPGGNALIIERNSHVSIRNSIFWGNNTDDFWLDSTSTLAVSYTTSQEPVPGLGNLTADPTFAYAIGDYHLQSMNGRWDPALNGGAGGWVMDTRHSPAIDAGDASSVFGFEPLPNGGRVNMGVYGNTEQASKSR